LHEDSWSHEACDVTADKHNQLDKALPMLVLLWNWFYLYCELAALASFLCVLLSDILIYNSLYNHCENWLGVCAGYGNISLESAISAHAISPPSSEKLRVTWMHFVQRTRNK